MGALFEPYKSLFLHFDFSLIREGSSRICLLFLVSVVLISGLSHIVITVIFFVLVWHSLSCTSSSFLWLGTRLYFCFGDFCSSLVFWSVPLAFALLLVLVFLWLGCQHVVFTVHAVFSCLCGFLSAFWLVASLGFQRSRNFLSHSWCLTILVPAYWGASG